MDRGQSCGEMILVVLIYEVRLFFPVPNTFLPALHLFEENCFIPFKNVF